MSEKNSAQVDKGLLGWLLGGVFLLVCAISAAGIAQQRMDLTAVALALVGFMGVLARALLGKREDDDI